MKLDPNNIWLLIAGLIIITLIITIALRSRTRLSVLCHRGFFETEDAEKKGKAFWFVKIKNEGARPVAIDSVDFCGNGITTRKLPKRLSPGCTWETFEPEATLNTEGFTAETLSSCFRVRANGGKEFCGAHNTSVAPRGPIEG